MFINQKSLAYRKAASRMDFYAVCLVGWTRPRPMDFGDNKGILPVKIVIRKKESEAAKEWDQESPHAEVEVLEHILVPTLDHANKLKDILTEILLGQQEEQDNKGLRRSFRNVIGCWEPGDEAARLAWWTELLNEAQRLLRLRKIATSFEMYDDEEAHRKINRKATKGH